MGLLDDAIKEHLDLKRRRGADPTEVERLEREALGPVRRGPEPAGDILGRDSAPEPAYDYEAAGGVAHPADEVAEDWAEPLEEQPFADQPVVDREPLTEREPLVEHAPLIEHEPLADPVPEYEAPRHHEIAEEWHAHEARHAEESRAPEDRYEPFPAEDPRPADEPPAGQRPLHDEASGLEPDSHPPATPPPAFASPPPGAAQLPAEPPDEAHLNHETAEYDVEAEHRRPREGEDDVLEETPEFLQDTPEHDRLWFEQRPPKDFNFDS